jgi:hypothetical protein
MILVALMVCFLYGQAEMLKLQHEGSDCVDIRELVQFKRSYNISNALQHATSFQVSYDDVGGKYKVLFTCENIFRSKEEIASVWPPQNLNWMRANDKEYLDNLILGDSSVLIYEYYMANRQNNGDGYNWPKSQLLSLIQSPSTCGLYNHNHCEAVMSKYSSFVIGKVGMVVGSQTPWAEALGFRFGAARMITYEYMKIVTDFPSLTTYHPSEVAAKFLDHTFEPVDFIISYSSLEHDGLGRYGDPLNAFGDFESIAKMHCMLKTGGLLFFGVPVGVDEVQYNAHRVYGYKRLSVVLSLGFRLIDMVNHQPFRLTDRNPGGDVQPMLVLQKHELHEIHEDI